jgi:hypothetical protein
MSKIRGLEGAQGSHGLRQGDCNHALGIEGPRLKKGDRACRFESSPTQARCVGTIATRARS